MKDLERNITATKVEVKFFNEKRHGPRRLILVQTLGSLPVTARGLVDLIFRAPVQGPGSTQGTTPTRDVAQVSVVAGVNYGPRHSLPVKVRVSWCPFLPSLVLRLRPHPQS